MTTTPNWAALDAATELRVQANAERDRIEREHQRQRKLVVLRAQSGQAQLVVQQLASQIAGTVQNDLRVARIVAALQLAEELIEKAHAGIGAELTHALSERDRAQAADVAGRG